MVIWTEKGGGVLRVDVARTRMWKERAQRHDSVAKGL
jgi:hypothetical protein